MLKLVIGAALCSVAAAVDFEACAFITERESSTFVFVPIQSKYAGQRTWARIDPKTRKVETNWGAYWLSNTWSFGGIGAGIHHRSQFVNGQSGSNCLNEGSTVYHWGSDPNGSLKRINDLRATLCPPIKGKLKVRTILLGDEASFRDCVEKALTKTDMTVSGLYHDSKAKKCYIAVDGAIPKIEDAIEDAGDGHFSCSFDGPISMPGGIHKAGETPREDVGTADSLKECYDMGVAKYGQSTPAVMLHGNKNCQAMTGAFYGFDLNSNGVHVSMVSPFPTRKFEECFVLVEGDEHVHPYLFAPQSKMMDGARTWGEARADGSFRYDWGIYWAVGHSSPSYRIATHGNYSSTGTPPAPAGRGTGTNGRIDGAQTKNIECLTDGEPALWYNCEAGCGWRSAGAVRILKNPRHAACPPVKGKLTVRTVELAKNVASFRDCLAVAFDEHSDKSITGLHYDVKGKVCNAAVGHPLSDISEAVDNAEFHTSCSVERAIEMVGQPTNDVASVDVGDASKPSECFEMVRAEHAAAAHGAMLQNGKCKAVMDEVKGLAIDESASASAQHVFMPVAPFKPRVQSEVDFEDCYYVIEGSPDVEPNLFAPQPKRFNESRTWARVDADGQVAYGWGTYWRNEKKGGNFWNDDYSINPFGQGRTGIMKTDADHPAPFDTECFVDGTRIHWWKGAFKEGGQARILKDPRHAACVPIAGKLTVPTAELEKDVASFRDCVALAFDEHSDELITALHYDLSAKTCNAVIGVAVPDIKAAVDGQFNHSSCSFAVPTEIHGDMTKDNTMEEVGDAPDMKVCHEMVWRQYAGVAHAALLKDGKCKAVTEKVKGFEISEDGGSIMAPVATFEDLEPPTTTTTAAPTTTAEPTTTAAPTTTVAPTTTAVPAVCDRSRVNLEFSYIQENTLWYCGEATCFLHANGDAQLAKQQSVKDNLFPMMEELKGQFKSVKMTYAEFCDKNIEPFGQSNADFCYKFFNSLKPYDAEYREWIEDHWERKWPHSASGMDMLENQLDAFISTVQRANYSTATHDEDGNLNLRIALMLTDKGFHDYGDVREQFPDCKLDGQELCREYQIDNVGCQCVGYEYPSVEQVLDVLSEKQVNPIVLLGEPVDDSVYAAYTSLNVNVAEASAGQLSAVVMAPQNDSFGFNSAAVQAAVEALCVHVQSLEG